MSEEYSNRMIEAFIDKPSVTLWYQNAFNKFSINDANTIKWHWNWWAFSGGFLYLLYRKQYLASLILFILSSIAGMIFPFGLIVMVLTGGFATHFVYKGYKHKLLEVESSVSDEPQRIKSIREAGGYHQWVVWLYAFFVTILFLVIIYLLSIFINFRY